MVRVRLSNENGRESPRAAPTKRPRGSRRSIAGRLALRGWARRTGEASWPGHCHVATRRARAVYAFAFSSRHDGPAPRGHRRGA